ncbi:ATP-dependent helicase, partial [Pseudokineococcus sp. 1T1Z-3]|uniref:ATP-dependent helicase n=1 Tax=Pseudokineococcus sp. 1T1Z-3 TaxID=3132745 RepID=UPI0030A0A9CD
MTGVAAPDSAVGRASGVRLVRRRQDAVGPPELDADQRRVVETPPGRGPLVVLGAPGTGRTTTLVELVAHRVARGVDAGSVLLLAPGRLAAAALRDRVGARLERTALEPAARSWHAYAFALLRRAALTRGEPAPRLVSGPEQDRVLADLLAGHARGEGRRPSWPPEVLPALGPTGAGLRGLRDELRDLVMRCLERGVTAEELAEHGARAGRPAWEAAASVLAEYEEVTALRGTGALDPSALVDAAARLLEDDPDLAAAERQRWSLVGVDDHQEAGAALARLLEALLPPGTASPDLVVTGDPDSTTQSFRGADPRHLTALADRAEVVVLGTRHRGGPEVAAAVARAAEGVPSAGLVAHRKAAVTTAPPARPGDERPAAGSAQGSSAVARAVLGSAAAEGAYVAHVLREEHLLGGTPWSAMAVLVRSVARTAALERALVGAGVPVGRAGAQVPVRDEPAVRPLLLALAVALDQRAGTREHLDAEAATALLTSPLGGADALALRRLRRWLRARELDGGGEGAAGPVRGSDELLVELLADDTTALAQRVLTGAEPDVRPAARVLEVLGAARAAMPPATHGRPAGASPEPDAGDAEEVLWALWQASGLGPRWRDQALAGGPAGRRADRSLDAVVALFEAVARFADSAVVRGPRALLAQLASQDLPADTLAERAPEGGTVALLTPQAAAGQEWDVVVVAGLQEGVWPDTRQRDGLLGAQALVDLLTGRTAEPTGDGGRAPGTSPGGSAAVWAARRAAARAQVVADERRLLHVAVSRARRRLVVTAVADGDARPSPFLDVVAPVPAAEPGLGRVPAGDDGAPALTPVPRPVTLPALVAELRQVLTAPAPAADDADPERAAAAAARRQEAAVELARLA